MDIEDVKIESVGNPLAILADARCMVCGCSLQEGKVTRCAKCDTPVHRDCWNYAQGCARFGCAVKPTEGSANSDRRGIWFGLLIVIAVVLALGFCYLVPLSWGLGNFIELLRPSSRNDDRYEAQREFRTVRSLLSNLAGSHQRQLPVKPPENDDVDAAYWEYRAVCRQLSDYASDYQRHLPVNKLEYQRVYARRLELEKRHWRHFYVRPMGEGEVLYPPSQYKRTE